MMKKSTILWVAIGLFLANFSAAAQEYLVKSPNGRLKINFYLNPEKAPRYSIELDGRKVLLESKLGLIRQDADFSRNLKLVSVSKPETVRDRYEILTAKRRLNYYQASRVIFHLQTISGQKMDIIFQVSNDGLAFRYFFPETDGTVYRLAEETKQVGIYFVT